MLLLAILVVGGAVVWLIDRLFYARDRMSATSTPTDDDESDHAATGCADEGCGLRSVCPSEQVLAGACVTRPVYYDDEELDRFAGRGENDYTDDEVEQWRDVLYTLLPADRLGWGQSVKRRGLVMPVAIRDEFLQLAGEQNAAQTIK